jgi:hypothetical protein
MTEKQMLQEAVIELKSLRNQNQLMRARLDVFDSMMMVLRTEPARSGSGLMHPDVVYEIEKHLEAEKQTNKAFA